MIELLVGLAVIGVVLILVWMVLTAVWLILPYAVIVVAAGFLVYFTSQVLRINNEEAHRRQRIDLEFRAQYALQLSRKKELDDLYARAATAWERKWQEKLSDASGAMPKLLPKPSDFSDSGSWRT